MRKYRVFYCIVTLKWKVVFHETAPYPDLFETLVSMHDTEYLANNRKRYCETMDEIRSKRNG